MKLHLPSSLRKALLSCIAAFSSILPSTVASGSSLLAVGAVASIFYTQHQAFGAFTEPDIQWDTDSRVEINGTNAKANLDENEGTNLWLGVWGGDTAADNIAVYNGLGKNLRLTKLGAASPSILSKEGKHLDVTTLYLESSANGGNTRYDINQASYLTSNIQNIYINAVALYITGNHTDLVSNFSLGTATGKTTGFGNNANTSPLSIGATVTTTGYLEAQESTILLLQNAAGAFTVGSLQGAEDADLTLISKHDNNYLLLSNGGENFRGKINFSLYGGNDAQYLKTSEIRLGEGSTLNVKGITGEQGKFTAASGTATLNITGSDEANTVDQISFSNITVNLADGARQTFTNADLSTSLVLGENSVLGLGGTVTLDSDGITATDNSMINFTAGTLKLHGNGSIPQLNIGNAESAATLELQSGSATIKTLTLNGDVNLNVLLSNLPSLNVSTLVGNNKTVQVGLADEVLVGLKGGQTLKLFGNASVDSSITLTWGGDRTFGRQTVRFDTDTAVFTVDGDHADLEYTGADGFTWNTERNNTPWLNDGQQDSFYTGDNVTLGGANTARDVTLGGELKAGSINVQSGTWNLSGGNLSSASTQIEQGATIGITAGTTFNPGTLSGEGTIHYQGGTLTLDDTSAFTGTLHLTSNFTTTDGLTFAPGGKITTDGAEGRLTINGTFTGDVEYTATVGMQTSTTIFNAGSHLKGTLKLGKQTYLNFGDNVTIDCVDMSSSPDTHDFGTWQAAGSTGYIGTLVRVSMLRLQGPAGTRSMHLTGAFDGKTSTIDQTFALDQNSGAAAGHVYFDGKVSNLTSISNNLNRTGDINVNGKIYFTGGIEVSNEFSLIGKGDASHIVQFIIQSDLTGNGNLIKTEKGKLIIDGGDHSGYEGELTINNSEGGEDAATISTNLTTLRGLNVMEGNTLTITGSSTTVGTTAVNIEGTVALTDGATLDFKGTEGSIAQGHITGGSTETLSVSKGKLTADITGYTGRVAATGGYAEVGGAYDTRAVLTATAGTLALVGGFDQGTHRNVSVGEEAELLLNGAAIGKGATAIITANGNEATVNITGVQLTSGGVLHVQAGDGSIITGRAATHSADEVELQILATGAKATMKGLTLQNGEVLGFAEDAGAIGSRSIILSDVTLRGGSTLGFDVLEAEDPTEGWITGNALTGYKVDGALTLDTKTEQIKIALDPYMRMNTGDICVLKAGTYVLIEGIGSAGMSEEEKDALLNNFAQATVPLERLAYALGIDDAGNLIVEVSGSDNAVSWDSAEGGIWNTDPENKCWSMSRTPSFFERGDNVTFGTQRNATDVVQIEVQHGATEHEQVTVSSITVKGSTSYRIDGDIYGYNVDGVTDKGLQVGTAGEAFTGTITLNGNNAWYGDNTISSGTVEALTPLALSNVTTRLTGGELQLNYEDGAIFAGTLVFTGGALTALQSAEANAIIGDATLNAATDATLTVHRMEGSTAGALRINYNMTDAGEVRLVFDSAAAGASALQVNGGDFTLINASGEKEAAFNVAGAVTLSNQSVVHVSSGITLSGNMQATGGSIELEAGSALKDTAVNGAVATLISHGATLTGGKEGAGTTVEQLEIHGHTAMSGNWEVHELVHEDGDITIADGTTVITPAEDTQAAGISVQNGATLRGGNEAAMLTLKSLELGSAPEESADTAESAAKLAAGSNITATEVTIANGTVAKDASLTIADGGHATVSGAGSSIDGRLILDGTENGAELTISDEAALTGELLILAGQATISSDQVAGYITLGSANATLDLTDVAASSTITMVADAQLLHTSSFTGTIIVDDRQGVGAFELGGITSGASVQLLNLQGKSYVSGITEGLNLTGASLISLSNSQRDRQNALIRFADESSAGAYAQLENATLTIDVSGIAHTVTKAGSKGVTYYVFNKGVQGNFWNAAHTIFQAELALYQMDVSFSSLDGSLTFTYTGPMGGVDIYVASEDNENGEMVVTDYDAMESYAGVVLDGKTRVDLTGQPLDEEHPDGLVLRNLSGTSEGELTILGDGTGQTLVTISNTITDDQIDEFIHDHPGLEKIENIFTVAGNVSVNEADLRIKHISDADELLTSSRTRMTGALSIEGGELQMVSGELELAGGADVQDVVFTGTNGQLVINACTAAMSNIRVEELEAGEGAHTEHIRIENAGHLQLKTGTQVGEHIIIGNVAAEPQELAGYVNVSGKSTMGQSVELHRVVLDLAEGSRLSVSSSTAQPLVRTIEVEEEELSTGTWDLAGMSGKGELSTATDHDIDITVAGEDHVFSGNLASYHGTMTIGASSYTQVFSGVVGGDNWNLTNTDGGRITLDIMGGDRHTNTLNMGDLTLQSGSITTIMADLLTIENERHGLHMGELSIEDGATVTVSQYDEGLVTIEGDGIIHLGTLTGEDTTWDSVNWQLNGVRNVTSVVGYSENGEFYLKAVVDNSNLYAKYADNENSAAGAEMLWSVKNSAQYGDDLAALDETAYALLSGDAWKTPGNVTKANKLLAAAAGASTAALGEALSSDVERQLRAVRNRTTNLSYSEKNKSAAWLNAETNYHKQSGDGLLPGYKLNGWGGTVGAHTTVGNAATVGLALTAMYNDVESNDADRIKGDMDNYYLTGFAQMAHGAWRHTLVATVGTASVDVNRTVSHEGGSYTTKGSTDGYAFGMLYEVGYTMPLKSDYSLCLQPVFNVAWRSGSLDSYTESGSNAALNVAEQSYNTITFGLGARLQAAVGTNAWNRTGLLEARALVKADAGDRQGEVETSFAKVPGSASGHLKSAERGAVGVELGAGVTVPTGASGAVFADFSAELRTDYTNFNVTAGYKINF